MSGGAVKKTKNNYNLPGPGPGRPKGSKNKFTTLKDAFLGVFEDMGGQEELKKWAERSEANRKEFYRMITKMLPTNVAADLSGELTVAIKRTITSERPKE